MKWKSSETYRIDIEGPSGKAVSCDFTDELEALAVRKVPVEIFYGEPEKSVHGIIKDFFIREKIDYMVLTDGAEIPLKEIHRIKT